MTRKLILAVWLAASIFAPAISFAALGDKVTLGPTATSTESRLYAVRESTADLIKLREFIAADGTIFAVTWLGMSHPDMATLLGRFHSDFAAADSATPRVRGSRHREVSGNDVTVERWGRPRALAGRAYATSLLPNGVSIDAIR